MQQDLRSIDGSLSATSVTVQCQVCGAKYALSPERVQGRSLRIRCANCQNVFRIDAQSAGADAGAPSVRWFAAINRQRVGPIGEAEVRERFAAGELTAQSYLWRQGMAQWQRLGALREFSDLVAPLDLPADRSSAELSVERDEEPRADNGAGMAGERGLGGDAELSEEREVAGVARASGAGMAGERGMAGAADAPEEHEVAEKPRALDRPLEAAGGGAAEARETKADLSQEASEVMAAARHRSLRPTAPVAMAEGSVDQSARAKPSPAEGPEASSPARNIFELDIPLWAQRSEDSVLFSLPQLLREKKTMPAQGPPPVAGDPVPVPEEPESLAVDFQALPSPVSAPLMVPEPTGTPGRGRGRIWAYVGVALLGAAVGAATLATTAYVLRPRVVRQLLQPNAASAVFVPDCPTRSD